ncbi:hypothetical protein ACVWYN_001041 [Pedobacter sp. UYP24]
MKTTTQISTSLVSLLREQQFVQAYKELFSDSAISIDPVYGHLPPMEGLSLLIEREEKFLSNSDIHDVIVSEPLNSGNYFAVNLTMGFTTAGQLRKIEELCVYHTLNGKIIQQQFFIS